MKTKITVRLALLALAMVATGLSGQQSQGPGSPALKNSNGQVGPVATNDLAERLQARSELSLQLGLSAAQEAQVARIREQQRLEVTALNQNRMLSEEQRREQIVATVRKYSEQVTALLNQDQLRILDQDRARERDRLRTLQAENIAERLQSRSQLAITLGLTADQLRQVERIREQQRAQIEAMNQNSALTPEQRREQIAAAVRNYGEQVRAVLTKEQVAQMEQIMTAERTRVRTTQAEEVAELLQRRAQLGRELGLSPDQEAQLARIREQQRAELAAMNQNRELSAQQRREQIAAILRKYGEQMRAMLKADQLQKLDQLRDLDRDRDRTRDRKRVDRPASD